MPREIDRDELLAKLQDPEVRLLDAQAPGWYEREHLPGAIRGRIDHPDGTLAQLGHDLDAEIVVYCYNATCTGSELAAKLLEGRGYRNVWRYTAGKQDWIDAGLPLEARTEHS
jgi:rhodanese-related sulfurtransferase